MFDDDDDEIGFVICASCGARIKANRQRCLRCEAPLVAWKKPELLPSWLQRWGGGTLIFGIVAAIAVVVVVLMTLDSSPSSEESARPLSRADVSRAVPSASNVSSGAAPDSSVEPVPFLDASRRGRVDVVTGDFASARTQLEEALEKKPGDAELLNNLGLALERLGQIDAAIARFASAANVEPQNWAYHFNLAHAASLRQDWDRAVTEYRTAAMLLPTDHATQYNLAMTLHQKGDEGSAIPEYQKGIAMAPSVAGFHLALAVSLEKVGRMNDAAREYNAYVEMAPSAPDASRVKAHAQTLAGRPPS